MHFHIFNSGEYWSNTNSIYLNSGTTPLPLVEVGVHDLDKEVNYEDKNESIYDPNGCNFIHYGFGYP